MSNLCDQSKEYFSKIGVRNDYNYFQVNGHTNCSMKFQRKDLERLLKEDAIKFALKQKEIQRTLLKRNILDVNFLVHSGCQGILNIITDQPTPKNSSEDVLTEK